MEPSDGVVVDGGWGLVEGCGNWWVGLGCGAWCLMGGA